MRKQTLSGVMKLEATQRDKAGCKPFISPMQPPAPQSPHMSARIRNVLVPIRVSGWPVGAGL